jgi:hypothetical protein
VIEISKDKKVSDLEEKVRKKLRAINCNDFLYQIYPKEKPITGQNRCYRVHIGYLYIGDYLGTYRAFLYINNISGIRFLPNAQISNKS